MYSSQKWMCSLVSWLWSTASCLLWTATRKTGSTPVLYMNVPRPQARKRACTHCLCMRQSVPKSWYIVYFRKTVCKLSYLAYNFMLNQPWRQLRLLPTKRVRYMIHERHISLDLAETVVPWVASGQIRHVFTVSLKTVLQ